MFEFRDFEIYVIEEMVGFMSWKWNYLEFYVKNRTPETSHLNHTTKNNINWRKSSYAVFLTFKWKINEINIK